MLLLRSRSLSLSSAGRPQPRAAETASREFSPQTCLKMDWTEQTNKAYKTEVDISKPLFQGKRPRLATLSQGGAWFTCMFVWGDPRRLFPVGQTKLRLLAPLRHITPRNISNRGIFCNANTQTHTHTRNKETHATPSYWSLDTSGARIHHTMSLQRQVCPVYAASRKSHIFKASAQYRILQGGKRSSLNLVETQTRARANECHR